MQHPHRPTCRFLLLTCLLGCWSLDSPQAPDAHPTDGPTDVPDDVPFYAEVESLEVLDRSDRAWPLDGAPRRPTLRLRFNTALAEDDVVFLLATNDLTAVAADLARKPLLVAHQRVRVPARMEFAGAEVLLEPEAPLDLDTTYILGLADWARTRDGDRFRSYAVQLTTLAADAGADVVGSWPPGGAAGVPVTLGFAAIRFDDEFHGLAGIGMRGEGPVRTEVRREPCDGLGWGSGTCAVLGWEGPLHPGREYTLTVDDRIVDRAGASIGPWSSTFRTGLAPSEGPRLIPLECAPDEISLEGLCVLADEHSVRVRGACDQAVRAFLRASSGSDRQIATRGEIDVAIDGQPEETTLDAELQLHGLGGETLVLPLTLATTSALATLTIAEVRADPRGPEPRQEYVEVLNFGSAPVSLLGVSLSDRPDRLGDVIEVDASIPAGGRALLVPDAFDPNHPDDPAVPDGIPLVRIGSSLASGGLSNAGEPLYLRDAALQRLSTVDAAPAPGPGVCLVRNAAVRSGPTVSSECTPGRATSAD